jgi:hypothetical protein
MPTSTASNITPGNLSKLAARMGRNKRIKRRYFRLHWAGGAPDIGHRLGRSRLRIVQRLPKDINKMGLLLIEMDCPGTIDMMLPLMSCSSVNPGGTLYSLV